MTPFSRPALGALAAVAMVAMVAGAAPATATNDPHWPLQWAPVKVGAPAAWATTTGAGVKIGIVDSGVDLSHEDLAGKVAASTSCIGTQGEASQCSGSGQDVEGHGTHVAGIAVATKDNGRGIAGIAPGAQLVVARAFDGESARVADVVAGIKWVVDQGARVVNLSVGDSFPLFGEVFGSSSLRPGIDYAWANGAVPVLAAGNTNYFGLGAANYGDANAVVVAATGRSDEPASYSSPTGDAKWALAAPGGNTARGGEASAIFSTFWQPGKANQYAYQEGTSMAVPHVSGALALLLSRPGMTNQRAVEILLSTADRRVRCGANSPTCVGRLDVARAVAATGGAPSVAPAPRPPAPAPTARPAPASASRPKAPAATAPPAPPPAPAAEAPPAEAAPAEVTEEPPAPATPDPAETPPPVVEVAQPSPIRPAPRDTAGPAVLAGILLVGVTAATAAVRRRARAATVTDGG